MAVRCACAGKTFRGASSPEEELTRCRASFGRFGVGCGIWEGQPVPPDVAGDVEVPFAVPEHLSSESMSCKTLCVSFGSPCDDSPSLGWWVSDGIFGSDSGITNLFRQSREQGGGPGSACCSQQEIRPFSVTSVMDLCGRCEGQEGKVSRRRDAAVDEGNSSKGVLRAGEVCRFACGQPCGKGDAETV